jgi:hypothetical protein
MLLPKLAPLQFGKSSPQPFDRLLARFCSVRLRQDKMNRCCSIRSQKSQHYGQMLIYQLSRTTTRTVWAKSKLTSKVGNYSGDVPTTSQRTHHRMTTAHFIGQFNCTQLIS